MSKTSEITLLAALPDRALAEEIYGRAVQSYITGCRERVPGFVRQWYGAAGSLRVHRRALGWDLARAPANLLLAIPQAMLQLTGGGLQVLGRGRIRRLRRWGVSLRAINLLLKTDVARAVEWAVYTELLCLPFANAAQHCDRDALAETLLSDPQVNGPITDLLADIGAHGDDPQFRARLSEAIETYTGSRAAAAEITTALTSLGVGAVAFHQATPGMVSLGPALAGVIAHQAAVASFPLGASLGGFWYAAFPAAPSVALIVGVTGGVMVLAAVLAAFAGILADPVQKALGLHERRLMKLLDSLEADLSGTGTGRFIVRDHYVARLLDLFDILRAAHRLARG